MSQQAPASLLRISHRLKGTLLYPNKPGLSSDLGRLILLLSVSVCLTFWLTPASVDANLLFQSPQSPPAQPAAEQAPVEQPPVEPPPVEQPPAEQAPAEQAPVEQAPVEQAPVEQVPVEQAPAEQVPVEQPPAEQPPAEPPPVVQPAAESAPPAEQVVTEPAPAEPVRPEPVSRRREEASIDETESGGPAQFIMDQAEFIDTVIISGAYLWLCCGVSALLVVPLGLLFVYIRGRSKIIGEDF